MILLLVLLSAVRPHMAAKQNFTVAANIGVEREVAFQCTKTGYVTSVLFENWEGSCWAYSAANLVPWPAV